mgnify:CR=1 FL=1
MIRRVMLDIETLGTAAGSVFFSIGAVEFSGGKLGDSFEVLIDPKDAQARGLKIEAGTVAWWMGQGVEARAAALGAWQEGRPLHYALLCLRHWLERLRAGAESGFEIWGNAPSLDCALVEEGYRALGEAAPWQFWQERCYRTLKNLRPDVQMVRTGTHHVALDDARDQARHAIALLEALGCADWEGAKFEHKGTEGTEAGTEADLEALAAAGDLRDEGERVIVPDREGGR